MIIGNLEGKPAEFSSSHLTLVFDVVCGLCTEEMHINKQKPIVSIFTESPPHSGKIKTESIHDVKVPMYIPSRYFIFEKYISFNARRRKWYQSEDGKSF